MGVYGKIKSHLTGGASERRLWRFPEARPFWSTSPIAGRRAARSVSLGVPSNIRPTVPVVPTARVRVSVLPALGLHVNVFASEARSAAGPLPDAGAGA